ncbi:MAG: nucleoside-diphosphate sugar epimerase/dehydratase, partial [Ginsengibacter sp.]
MPNLLFKNLAPRWIIFCCDLALIVSSFVCSFFLARYFLLDKPLISDFFPQILTHIGISIACILVFAIYSGIIRYSETKDIVRIIKFGFLQFGLWLPIILLFPSHLLTKNVSVGLLLINLFVVIFTLVVFRLLVKEVYFRALARPKMGERAIIYGASAMGLIVKKVLEQDTEKKNIVLGFIDDDYSKVRKNLEGLPIFKASGQGISKMLKEKDVTHLYISINKLSVEKKLAITDLCAALQIKINIVPDTSQWSGGQLQKEQLHELNIEELLEREEITLPSDVLRDTYHNATVLVTGAAGSIGSEICRQLTKFSFKKLILLDQSESGLFDLEYELRRKDKRHDLQTEIASARDYQRLKKIFSIYQPDIVFHAAAYKHVPLMEVFPSEAILTNIIGTKNIADLASHYGVKKFVLISTDKAVNPTNVMGATKRISELYIQSVSDQKQNETDFIITRFGNVLGSAGSVVATFKKQISEGGPVTITHPEITRYFMTIPEASKLVLEAGKIGKSGDILLFDMGKPVKILDLATRMIQLAGYKPYDDISIVQTQLRPGEKMFEELFKDTEEFVATDHPRILKAKKATDVNPEFMSSLLDLEEAALSHNNELIPFILRKMLPE